MFYSEEDIDNYYQLIIQFKIKGKWGEPNDLLKRDKMKILLKNLFLENEGVYDGRDIGSGTMNIFCFVPNPEKIVNIIIEEMNRNNFENNYIIAKQKDEEIEIIYPQNYKDEFSF